MAVKLPKKSKDIRPRLPVQHFSSEEIPRFSTIFQQIGRLESENKSLSKSLENTGGDKQQLQEMQSMVMKLAAAKAEPVSGGKADTAVLPPKRVDFGGDAVVGRVWVHASVRAV